MTTEITAEQIKERVAATKGALRIEIARAGGPGDASPASPAKVEYDKLLAEEVKKGGPLHRLDEAITRIETAIRSGTPLSEPLRKHLDALREAKETHIDKLMDSAAATAVHAELTTVEKAAARKEADYPKELERLKQESARAADILSEGERLWKAKPGEAIAALADPKASEATKAAATAVLNARLEDPANRQTAFDTWKRAQEAEVTATATALAQHEADKGTWGDKTFSTYDLVTARGGTRSNGNRTADYNEDRGRAERTAATDALATSRTEVDTTIRAADTALARVDELNSVREAARTREQEIIGIADKSAPPPAKRAGMDLY